MSVVQLKSGIQETGRFPAALDGPLRLGVLIADGGTKNWQADTVAELAASKRFELTVIRARGAAQARAGRGWRARLASAIAGMARQIELRLSCRAAQIREIWAQFMTLRDVGTLGAGVGALTVDVTATGAGGEPELAGEAITAIEALQLDVLVVLGEMPVPGSLRRLPRYGAWHVCYGDGTALQSGLPLGFWEVYYNIRRTAVAIERAGTRPLDKWVLRRGWYPTETASWTINELCSIDYARVMLIDALRLLHLSGRLPQCDLDNIDSAEQPLAVQPGTLQWCVGVAKLLVRRLGRRLAGHLFSEQWYLLAGAGSDALRLQPGKLRSLLPQGSKWWADPFVFENEGKAWIFAEEKANSASPADICVFEQSAGGFRRVGVALSPGYHVSYPFVFRHNARIYMLPETSSNDSIELWECEDFPLRWRKCRTVMSGLKAADNTLVESDGRWWLFTTISRSKWNSNYCVELFAFSSDDPVTGEWVPHQANPIVTDCRRARMAGPFFRSPSGDTLYRVAQGNSRTYGDSIAICRVDKLTQTEYQESLVHIYEPDWSSGLTGTHHLSLAAGIAVMDVKRRVIG